MTKEESAKGEKRNWTVDRGRNTGGSTDGGARRIFWDTFIVQFLSALKRKKKNKGGFQREK